MQKSHLTYCWITKDWFPYMGVITAEETLPNCWITKDWFPYFGYFCRENRTLLLNYICLTSIYEVISAEELDLNAELHKTVLGNQTLLLNYIWLTSIYGVISAEELDLIAELHKTDFHILGNFWRGNSTLLLNYIWLTFIFWVITAEETLPHCWITQDWFPYFG